MYKAIRNKKIKINRKRCQFDQQLKEGDIVLLFLPPEFLEEKVTEIPLYTGNLDVIYEDSDILIVNKEAGLLSQSDQAGQQDTLVGRVQYYLYAKKEYDPEQENSFTPALCHRLDKNTQGLVIAAKNARALRIMNQAIKEHKIQKYYYAVVEGTFSQKDFSITCFIKKEQTKALVSRSYKEGYKEASMDVHVMDSNPNGSLIQVLLKTGRFHQIRAKCNLRGIQSVVMKDVLEQRRIKHNITMIGHKHIVLVFIYMPDPLASQSRCTGLDNPQIRFIHHFFLKIRYIIYFHKHIPNLFDRHIRKHKRSQCRKQRVGGYTPHGSRNFFIIVWTNIIKHAYNPFSNPLILSNT